MADEKRRDDRGDVAIELGDRGKDFDMPLRPPPSSSAPGSLLVVNNPLFAILAYCDSSILMTVTNKYVLSGLDFNLNFFLLCVQSVVCPGRRNDP